MSCIIWNAQGAEWLQRASDFTGFHKKLAALLRPFVDEEGSLRDIGCGSGLIGAHLHLARGLTCVDADPAALACLRAGRRAKGLPPARTLLADGGALRGTWDTVLTVFHGGGDDFLRYLGLSRRFLVSVVGRPCRAGGTAGFCRPKANDPQKVRAVLEENGIPHLHFSAALEYGQPLASLDEARAYVAFYEKNPPGMPVDAYLSRCLVETGRRDWPLYLPNNRHFGFL